MRLCSHMPWRDWIVHLEAGCRRCCQLELETGGVFQTPLNTQPRQSHDAESTYRCLPPLYRYTRSHSRLIMDSTTVPSPVISSLECSPVTNPVFIDQATLQTPFRRRLDHATSVNTPPMDHDVSPTNISSKMHSIQGLSTPPTSSPPPTCDSTLPHRKRTLEARAHMRKMFRPYRHRVAPPR